jgi:SAM-dependent methyltransferase
MRDRFGLVLRAETRELPVYALVQARKELSSQSSCGCTVQVPPRIMETHMTPVPIPSTQMPPHAVLMEMLTGKWVSTMISALAHFGVADHLASGPRTPPELAELTNTQPGALYRLLRAAASLGIFTELEDGRFANTALSEPLRTTAVPCIRNMAMMMLDGFHVDSWAALPWCVETGKPAPYKLFGMHAFEWFAHNPDKTVNFHNAMSDMSQADSPVIAASYDFSRFASVMDVAGGLGTLLAAILARTPGLRGTLFEVPPVADQARRSPILMADKDRVEILGGSFLEEVPGGSDAYILKHILHDWEDEDAMRILQNVRRAMGPEGRLLIIEQVVSARNEPGLAKLMDLEMMVLPGGRERTEPEWKRLLDTAGFRLERVIQMPVPQCIIEGTAVQSS